MKKNLVLIAIVVILAVIPFFVQKGAEFSGADGQAEKVITQINPDYQPWLTSFWEPPSGEIESLLFAVQAALGAGFMGYFIGYSKGKKFKGENNSNA